MQHQSFHNKIIANRWKAAWSIPGFRKRLVWGTVIFFAILLILPFFFKMIEQREGYHINDWLLKRIISVDMSLPTFLIIWGMTSLTIVRSVQDPPFFLVFLFSLVLVFISRMLTIYFIPLNPPDGWITLHDPVSNLFYGGRDVFITRDLFYSGHTATQFLMFLCFKKRKDKMLALLSTLLVGSFVLIQHVHYTIDVMGAIVCTYLMYLLGKKWANV